MSLNVLNRRSLLALAGSAPMLSGCFYDQFFDIEWDEEVQLHDGRIIVVHLKRTYERLGGIRARWEGVHRDTEISFDAGGKLGRFTKRFQRYDVGFLHYKDGNWYIALHVTTGTPPVQLTTWHKSVLLLKPDGSLTAFARAELPEDFKAINVMPPFPDSAGTAKFHNKTLKLKEKFAHWSTFYGSADGIPRVEINWK